MILRTYVESVPATPDIAKALELADPIARLLETAALVTERLHPTRLVVVGGLAVAYWTSAHA